MKTVALPTRLKLSESANFNAILIKFNHQVASASRQLISTNGKQLAVIHLTRPSNRKYNTRSISVPPEKLLWPTQKRSKMDNFPFNESRNVPLSDARSSHAR